MDAFTDDEIRVRLRECQRLEQLCRTQGEAEPANHYVAIGRAFLAEAALRRIDID